MDSASAMGFIVWSATDGCALTVLASVTGWLRQVERWKWKVWLLRWQQTPHRGW